MTINHYVGAWKGTIYGYRHSMKNHIIGRREMDKNEHYIKGLEFAGAHAVVGDGQAPQIKNGRLAAKAVLTAMQEKEGAK